MPQKTSATMHWLGVSVLIALAGAQCVPTNPVAQITPADLAAQGTVGIHGDLLVRCNANISGTATLESGATLNVAAAAALRIADGATYHADASVTPAFDGGIVYGGVHSTDTTSPLFVAAADILSGYYWSGINFGPSNVLMLPTPTQIQTALTNAGVTARVGMRLSPTIVRNSYLALSPVIINSTVPGGIYTTAGAGVPPTMTYSCTVNAICEFLYLIRDISPFTVDIIAVTL